MPISRSFKSILWGMGVLLSLFLGAILLLAIFFFAFFGKPSDDEVARLASPSGYIDAVLVETNGGATTSFGYEVYVVKHGAKPSGTSAVSLYRALRNPQAYGANISWSSPNSLTVEYLSAQIAQVNTQTQSVGTTTVQFVLREGVTDNAAPPGGMLYNLQGRP
jgi:hypothetical protein